VPAPRKSRPPSPDNIVALSPYRAQLARGRRSRRADQLFASSDPEAAIRALPADEFFYVIHELGFPEALDVLVHGTPEQVQTVLDFSIWERDRVALEKSDEWLSLLVEAPVKRLGEWAQGIDVELLALLVRKRARIHEMVEGEAPEDIEGVLWTTPDRLFALELLGETEQVRVTQHLVDSLYRYSPVMMRRLLVGMRAESDTDLEETAFRWRSGRMADLGFADFYEALAVYEELDPASVCIDAVPALATRPHGEAPDDAHLRLPMVMAERLSAETPFARAVAGISSREETANLHVALVALCNRALSADHVSPGDDEAIRLALDRVSAALDLAVEFLARGNREREVAAVRGVPVLTLHRLGVSLTGKLRRLALALWRGNPFAKLRPAIDVFEPDDAEVLASLTQARPLFPRLLESPPAPGRRPFATLADVALATRAVERAAAAVELLVGLGIVPGDLTPSALDKMLPTTGKRRAKSAIDPATIDASVLARTVLVARLLGTPSPPLAVLSAKAIAKFKHDFNSSSQLTGKAELEATAILRQSSHSATLDGPRLEVASRWIAGLCPLGPLLGQGKP
jgi:hypothetical protein